MKISDNSLKGYYFIAPLKAGASKTLSNSYQFILDKKGDVVYYKSFVGTTSDFKIQQNGLMSYSNAKIFYLLNNSFAIIDSVRSVNGIEFDGHDMQILANGHFLVMGYENIRMNLSTKLCFENKNKVGSDTALVKCGVIQELDANKKVVFEWHVKDHFSFEDVDFTRLTNPASVDWTHFNAVEMDKDGNILVSSRNFNEITKINKKTGEIIWRLGGKANQFTFLNDKEMFKGQHDIRRIANGNITLLDNGLVEKTIHPVAAKEYELDEIAHKAKLVWSYTANTSFTSSGIGGVQRLSSGNTMVNYGIVNDYNVMFEIVKPDGKKMIELSFKDSLRTYRAYYYETLPWKLKRPKVKQLKMNGKYYLDAGEGFDSYQWSTGQVSRLIEVSSNGTYWVFVPLGTGGFVSSEKFECSVFRSTNK